MAYIVKETSISCIINTLFGTVFFVALFHGQTKLILGGTSALTMDFLPQAFFVGLFAVLPSSLLTLKRLKAGTISHTIAEIRFPLPQSMPFRIVCLALGSLAIFGGGAVLILSLSRPVEIGFATALLLKAAYSIAITIILTPLAVGYLISADNRSTVTGQK